MLEVDVVAVFFLASVLLGLAPGPDNIYVLTQSAINGHAAGLIVTLGLCTGLLVHTSAVALGVAALFHTSAIAFNLFKLAGAGYLLFLAWQAFRASGGALDGPGVKRLRPLLLYRRGVLMNVTNPKVSLFFLAFLPQFTDPTNGSLVLQTAQLGGLFIIATLLVFGSISLLAGNLGEFLRRSPRALSSMNRITGLVLGLLAIRLLIAER